MSGSFSGSEQGMWRVRGKGDKRNPYIGMGSSTGFSSARNGNVTIDPSIRAIQEQNLAESSNLYNALGSQAEGLLGNRSDYVNARVAPLEREFNMRQGQTERNLGMRGLSGSSFGEQSLNSLANEKQYALGNARSLATQESYAEMARVRAQQAQLLGLDAQTARDRFQQELMALGLGEGEIRQMTQAFEAQANRQGGFQPYQSGHAGSGSVDMSGGGGSASAGSCWVAEVLYGVDSDKTSKLRQYFKDKFDSDGITGWFSRLYSKHGKKWAAVVDKNILARSVAHVVWGFYWLIAKGK